MIQRIKDLLFPSQMISITETEYDKLKFDYAMSQQRISFLEGKIATLNTEIDALALKLKDTEVSEGLKKIAVRLIPPVEPKEGKQWKKKNQ